MSGVATSSDIQKLENAIKNLERKFDDIARDTARLHSRLENLERAIQQEDNQTDKIEQIVSGIRAELNQVEQRLKQHIETNSVKNL